MRATVKDYFRSLTHSWAVAMSGPLGVPLTIAGYYASGPWLKVALYTTASACFLFCSFWVWRVERLARIVAIEEVRLLKEKGPDLEIVFDLQNTGRRFWSMESRPHPSLEGMHVTYWEYRVEIKNISERTIRNVRVSREMIGPLPIRAAFMDFDATKTNEVDINPGDVALVPVVQWALPLVQEGNLAGESAEAYGPIQVIASGIDSRAVIRIFRFNYQKMPMIYD